MSARAELLHHNAAKWLRTASLLEIETLIRCCAVELQDRAIPDTRELFAYARKLDQVRLGLRPRNNSD